jgi:hypothetical protein
VSVGPQAPGPMELRRPRPRHDRWRCPLPALAGPRPASSRRGRRAHLTWPGRRLLGPVRVPGPPTRAP